LIKSCRVFKAKFIDFISPASILAGDLKGFQTPLGSEYFNLVHGS